MAKKVVEKFVYISDKARERIWEDLELLNEGIKGLTTGNLNYSMISERLDFNGLGIPYEVNCKIESIAYETLDRVFCEPEEVFPVSYAQGIFEKGDENAYRLMVENMDDETVKLELERVQFMFMQKLRTVALEELNLCLI